MATSELPSGNAELTMEQFADAQRDLERQARKLERGCTYVRGYIRQPVYSCLTCAALDGGERAGVCESCAVACHEGHSLAELWDKRHFRCDCRTARMPPGHHCRFQHSREEKNDENMYNQNFGNKFCVCHTDENVCARAVYDPSEEHADMLQCLVCEDWFHETCMQLDQVPTDHAFESFICAACASGPAAFLHRYAGLLLCGASGSGAASKDAGQEVSTTEVVEVEDLAQQQRGEGDREQLTAAAAQMAQKSSSSCLWDMLPEMPQDRELNTCMFLKAGWRDNVCRCQNCAGRLGLLGVLLDGGDTTDESEDSEASSQAPSLHNEGLKAASMTLSHCGMMDAALAIRDVADELKEFLRDIKDANRAVTAEDVATFFEHRSKRRRLNGEDK